jgi:hypothetical protein
MNGAIQGRDLIVVSSTDTSGHSIQLSRSSFSTVVIRLFLRNTCLSRLSTASRFRRGVCEFAQKLPRDDSTEEVK